MSKDACVADERLGKTRDWDWTTIGGTVIAPVKTCSLCAAAYFADNRGATAAEVAVGAGANSDEDCRRCAINARDG
jgi:hypothetical protein